MSFGTFSVKMTSDYRNETGFTRVFVNDFLWKCNHRNCNLTSGFVRVSEDLHLEDSISRNAYKRQGF